MVWAHERPARPESERLHVPVALKFRDLERSVVLDEAPTLALVRRWASRLGPLLAPLLLWHLAPHLAPLLARLVPAHTQQGWARTGPANPISFSPKWPAKAALNIFFSLYDHHIHRRASIYQEIARHR